jgi:hypothetical protein
MYKVVFSFITQKPSEEEIGFIFFDPPLTKR